MFLGMVEARSVKLKNHTDEQRAVWTAGSILESELQTKTMVISDVLSIFHCNQKEGFCEEPTPVRSSSTKQDRNQTQLYTWYTLFGKITTVKYRSIFRG